MAQQTSNQRDRGTRQPSDQSAIRATEKGRQSNDLQSAGTSGRVGNEQADRERSIQTDRERTTSAGVARRPASSIYGPRQGLTGNPFLMMQRMAEDMDRLFDSFGFGRTGLGTSPFAGMDFDRDLWRQGSALQQSLWSPQVETFRRGDQLVVRADLPGMKKDDVKVEMEDGVLTISGERREEHEEDRDDYYRSERSYGQFYRAIPLPEGVSGEQCDASFTDGVLEVTLPAPRTQERKSKRIQIR